VVAHYLSLKYNIQFLHSIRAPDLGGPCFCINHSCRLCCYFFFFHLNCDLLWVSVFIAASLRCWKQCSSKIIVHYNTVHNRRHCTSWHYSSWVLFTCAVLFTCVSLFIKTSFFVKEKRLFSLVWNLLFQSFFLRFETYCFRVLFLRSAWHQSIYQKEGLIQLFSQDEINKVRSFLKELEKPTCMSLAYSSTSLSPLPLGKSQSSVRFNTSDKPSNRYWRLDSGVTDHTTPIPTHFSTYSPCPRNKKISTTDGSLIIVVGQGNVHIIPSIILQNVLHTPKLSTSLISIHKLTNDLSCNIVFFVRMLVFFRTRIRGGRLEML